MKYKFFIYGVGDETGAEDFDSRGLDNLQLLAEFAANDHWGKSDPDSSWPIELGLVDKTGQSTIFQVDMIVSEPTFEATSGE